MPLKLCLMFAACLAAGSAAAQSYPSKPIRLVVGSPPGGIDAYVRVFSPKAGEVLGQPLVIENRGGANGAIGAEHVARSTPDGYTVLFATSGALVHGVILSKNRTFDPLKDFTPISNMVETLKVMTVHASLPYTSVQEVIDYARRNPGKLTYASSGNTGIFHIAGEMFKFATGVDLLHVPMKGTAAMATELMSGRVDVGFAALNNVRPHLAAGKLRLLAVAEPSRYPPLANTPTIQETVPGFVPPPSWNGIVGPAGLPRPIVERLNDALVKSMDTTEVRAFLEKNGAVSRAGPPEELAATLRRDFDIAAKMLKAANIQAE